jgi:hypothetical protein
MEEAYPGAQRTYVKVRSGRVTGGNAALFGREHFEPLRDFAQEVFEARKSPMRLARMAGLNFAAKLAVGRLDLADVERRLEQLTGLDCAAIFTDCASIGADVDKPADVKVAEAKLQELQELQKQSQQPQPQPQQQQPQPQQESKT